MSKPVVLLLAGAVLVALLLGGLGPAWPFALVSGLGGGVMELGLGLVGAVFGVVMGALGAIFGLLMAGIAALLAGPLVLIVVLMSLMIGLVATVFAVALVGLPVLLPLALILGLIWLLARGSTATARPGLPVPASRSPARIVTEVPVSVRLDT